MLQLSDTDIKEFLKAYLEGILNRGLLEPLQELSKSTSAAVAALALSLYELQISGYTPEDAFEISNPRLPKRLIALIGLGFRKSQLDLVLMEAIKAYADSFVEEQKIEALDTALNKFSGLNNSQVCLECWVSEIEKLLSRAANEKAKKVLIQYEDGYIQQSFISTKLVKIFEAASPVVYETLNSICADLARGKFTIPNFSVQSCNQPHKYIVCKNAGELEISFVS